jgi:bacteriocin biosynthesis cyclodehydratase domain-containing protein
MASTLCLNENADVNNATYHLDGQPILVVPVGEFGHAIATQMKTLLADVTVLAGAALGGGDALLRDTSSIAVLATWRPVPALSNLLDARSFRTGAPFISLTLQDSTMLLGPIVVPGSGACWRCWASRELQSSPSSKVMQQRTSYYADQPNEGPQGYLPSLALFGGAQLARALEAIQRLDAPAGEVVKTDLYTRQISTGRAVGFDNCDRCGLHRSLASRSYADLQAGLMSIWQQS